MVMATGSLCQPYDTSDLSHEASRGGEAHDEAASEAAALHERLVAYVHALAPPHESRSGVWVEHSYARARGAAHAPASHVRVLLAPRVDPPSDFVDVERDDAPPPSPPEPRARDGSPADTDAEADADGDADAGEWEPRVTALAPSAAHLALAERALDALRRLRLARLADGRATHEPERAAARRLRHALAAASAARGAPAQRPAPWLHATLLAYLPRGERRLYDALVRELARCAPRVCARLTGGRAPPPRRCPLARVGPALGAARAPWLLWLCAGGERQDRRWRRRLGALLHTRAVSAPAPSAAPPEAWCAALAGSMRAALADALAEAGERAVIVGGAGAGAALCVALAGGAAGAGGAVRGLLLLALAPLTAEGARAAGDDPLAALRLPALLVAGTGAAGAARGGVRGLLRAREGGARRVLEVRGADDALRLPAALRRARRLPQHALDAAVAEECARWALETAEGGAGGAAGASPPPPPPQRARRRAAPRDDDEFAHLPAAARIEKPIDVASEARGARVVSRGSGATPLALLPPRRAAPAPPADLAAADIMRLPIVFADDERVAGYSPEPAAPPAEPDAGAVTVRSGAPAWRGGAGSYARVIVASRGARAAAAARPGAAPARPVLMRRAVRVVPRAAAPAPR